LFALLLLLKLAGRLGFKIQDPKIANEHINVSFGAAQIETIRH